MATKYHFSDKTYDDSDLNYLLDFDLSGFAIENFNDYWELNQGIKFEFSFHGEEGFKNGRIKFLNSVKNKSSIFRTEEWKLK